MGFLSGLQIGANIGNMRVAQQERMMQLRSQAALNAIHERQLAAQADMLAQHAALFKQQALKEQDEALTEKSVLAAAQEHHSYLVNELGLTEDQAAPEVINATARVSPTTGVKMAETYERVKRAQADLLRAKDATQEYKPNIISVPDPNTGKDVSVLRTGPQRSQMVNSKVPTELDQIQSINEAIQNTTDPELKKLLTAYAVKKTQATGMTIKTNPDGTFEITQGPVAGPDTLTKQNLSRAQEAQAQALNTIDVSNRLEGLLNNQTVGARAFAESWIKDRVLAQQFPELASKERAGAEQLAAQLRASAVKELRSDGNISEKEREQILQAVPKINDPVDSPARARQLVQGIRKMSAIHALIAAKRMGGSVPKAAALALDDEETIELAERGMITKEQVKQAWQFKHSQ